jgi:predicted DNA-binding transcriptional regulator YafY
MPKKWNDATSAEKLLALYTRLLFERNPLSLKKITEELGCSKQTSLRLLDSLEASRYGKLAQEKQGRENYYQLARPAALPKISLNAEGLRQLALCRNFLLHLLPKAMRENIEATLQQASAFLPDGEDNGAPDSFVSSFTKGHIDYTPFQNEMQILQEAVRKQTACQVRYRASLNREVKEYAFAPKRLVAFREAIYFVGWIVTDSGPVRQLHDTPTTLLLHRFEDAAPTNRSAARLPDAPEENSGVFGLMGSEVFAVSARFAASAATYVAERVWSKGQKVVRHKDGRITLTFTARSEPEAVAWILGFGNTAEVLSPKWLRKEVAEQVRALAKTYAD